VGRSEDRVGGGWGARIILNQRVLRQTNKIWPLLMGLKVLYRTVLYGPVQ
jgi:hypothetical protein